MTSIVTLEVYRADTHAPHRLRDMDFHTRLPPIRPARRSAHHQHRPAQSPAEVGDAPSWPGCGQGSHAGRGGDGATGDEVSVGGADASRLDTVHPELTDFLRAFSVLAGGNRQGAGPRRLGNAEHGGDDRQSGRHPTSRFGGVARRESR
jgi:hypothetical protein